MRHPNTHNFAFQFNFKWKWTKKKGLTKQGLSECKKKWISLVVYLFFFHWLNAPSQNKLWKGARNANPFVCRLCHSMCATLRTTHLLKSRQIVTKFVQMAFFTMFWQNGADIMTSRFCSFFFSRSIAFRGLVKGYICEYESNMSQMDENHTCFALKLNILFGFQFFISNSMNSILDFYCLDRYFFFFFWSVKDQWIQTHLEWKWKWFETRAKKELQKWKESE